MVAPESDQLELRELFEAAPDGILVCDLEGTIVRVNQQTERMFGYPRADLLGQRIEMLIPDQYQPQHAQHVACLGLRNDGTEFPIEISLSPIKTERGPMVAAAIRDVSARKRFEEQAREEVRHARELTEAASNAKSEFLASMSHELRTPLNAVLGFAQLLQRDRKQPLSERQQERIGYVLRGGEHLLKLIDQVLDLARIEAGGITISPEPVDVCGVLDEVASTLGPLAHRTSVQLAVAPVPTGLPAVTADRTRLVQILINFGSNAIKYNRSGGHVTFQVARERNRYLRIAVVDDGCGIPEDKLSKIFEPFQRAGQETGTIEGTGIGLAISKRLANLMNGSVGFESETDSGSTFWVQMPIDTGRILPIPSLAPAR